MRVEHEVQIDRPPDEVFAYFSDPANLTAWQDGLVEVKRDEHGPVRVGSRWDEVRSFGGRRMQAKVEVAEYEPGRRFSVRSAAGPIRFRVEHVLEPTGEGTRLRVTGEGESGGVMRVAGPLLARQVREGFASSFARLKERLESRP